MDEKQRLAIVETKQENYEKTQDEIFSYMREGRKQRDVVIQTLATLVEQSKKSIDYQEKCETDRIRHDSRITSLETSRTRMLGMTMGGSAATTSILGVIGYFLFGHKP